ncbi:enoyl-CoA hydratase [Rhodococcus erythropolis]
MTELRHVLYDPSYVDNTVALITLNRPDARNALSTEMLDELVDALHRANETPEIRAIVLTGNGSAFCAGLDLKQMALTGSNLRFEDGRPWPTPRKPIVCAVNGPAITGGLELALHCDFIIASNNAVFADTHTRVGIVPFWGMSVLLPAAIGARNAAYMSLTGRLIDASEAIKMGLVAQVVDQDKLIDSALAAASDIASAELKSTATLASQYRNITRQEWFDHEIDVARKFFADGFSIAEIEERRVRLVARNRAAMKEGE